MNVLRRQARKYKWTVMIGRTHGVHAEPITFGLKLALWYQEMARHLVAFSKSRRRYLRRANFRRCGNLRADLAEGRGVRLPQGRAQAGTDLQSNYSARPPCILFCDFGDDRQLAWKSLPIEVRHLQRTEVQEAEEPFTEGQKGSSAMPHKRNPIFSENVSGLARLMRSYAHGRDGKRAALA